MKILKKALVTIAIILIIFASSVTIAVTKSKGKVTTETLRLRKEASLESTVLELLSKDDEVEIVEEEGDWYKVNFKTYTGYVSKEYISKNDNSEGNSNPKQNEDNNGKENNEDTNKTPDDNTNKATNNDNNINNTNNKKLANKQAKTNSDLNVYILPLINSNIIGNIKQNTKVDIVNITGVWAYIRTETLAGWIKVDKISVTDSNTTENNNTNNQNKDNSEQTTSQNNSENQTNNNQTNNQTDNNQTTTSNEKEYTPKNYYIKSSAVNVRAKSSTSSNVITTLAQNTQVKAVGEEGDWYKVEVNGKSGYILKSLLSTNKVEVTSRSSIADRQTTDNSNNKKQTNNNNKEQEATTTNSSKGEEIVAYAKQFLGRKYVYGGSGPNTFDCSGFTMYVYKHFGYSMGHSAVTQAGLGKYVSKGNLQPGDLVIFNDSANRSIGHVGIYVGGGQFIHASSGSGKIIISSLSGSYYNTRYVTGRRII